ncbi:MAG TPA: alcohol dehydrogenase catalytic domain-containing protein [Ilumatobacter sp.]|nr:alcohol dehydrogenase catalytic domain-containing protein [Ilumatobacter sp.]
MVYTAPLELQILDVDEPAPEAHEVLVHVESCGICGSELEGIRSRSPFRVPPLVMGHEFGGVRDDTGERVVVNPAVSCGWCDLCLAGSANLCRHRAIVGIHRPGGFAERVSVPERNIYPIPESMSWEQAALVEPIANAVHAWRLIADRTPARVGVIGAGTIGLVSLIVARARGVDEVDVVDLAADRLRSADLIGASSTGVALQGEYDVVFDAVGSAGTRRASVEHIRPGGAAVWLGLHAEEPGFDGLGLIRMEKSVLGSFCYTDRDFRQAITMAASIDPFWVATYALDAGVDIFNELMNGRTDVVKAQLRV